MDKSTVNLCLEPVLMALGEKLDDDLIVGKVSPAGELALQKAGLIIRDFFGDSRLSLICKNSIALELLYWRESLIRSQLGPVVEKQKSPSL